MANVYPNWEWPIVDDAYVIQCRTPTYGVPVQVALKGWKGTLPVEALKAFDEFVEALHG